MPDVTAPPIGNPRPVERFNRRIVLWSITSALAGFLFGFDTVVISGAEQKIQSLWGLSAGVHGFAIASALYGTVLGSLCAGWPADRFGRSQVNGEAKHGQPLRGARVRQRGVLDEDGAHRCDVFFLNRIDEPR